MQILSLILSALLYSSLTFAQIIIPKARIKEIAASFPPPPAHHSAEDLKDIQEVAQVQSQATLQMKDDAKDEAICSIQSFFGANKGFFSYEENELLTELFWLVQENADAIVNPIKNLYQRKRPYARFILRRKLGIELNAPLLASTSYPSGHAAIAMATAETLALLYPEKKDQLLQRAKEIALGRVVGGVHHPIDVAAGLKAGEIAFQEIKNLPVFKAKLYMTEQMLKSKGDFLQLPRTMILNQVTRGAEFTVKIPQTVSFYKGGSYLHRSYQADFYFKNGSVSQLMPSDSVDHCRLTISDLQKTQLPKTLRLHIYSTDVTETNLNQISVGVRSGIDQESLGNGFIVCSNKTQLTVGSFATILGL